MRLMNRKLPLFLILFLSSISAMAQLGKFVDIGPFQFKVYEWNPGTQALGRFVEKCVKDYETGGVKEGFLILIGSVSDRFWVIEGGIENDAEDYPFYAQLTETFWDGKRKIHSMPPHKFKGNASDALMRQVWDWDKVGLLPKVETLQKIKIGLPDPELLENYVVKMQTPAGKYCHWHLKITQSGDCARYFSWEVK